MRILSGRGWRVAFGTLFDKQRDYLVDVLLRRGINLFEGLCFEELFRGRMEITKPVKNADKMST